MANCITNQDIKKRADKIFGTLGYLEKRRDLEFLNAFINTGLKTIPTLNAKKECVSLTVTWKDICEPTDVACDSSCDLTIVDQGNCVTETYPLTRCFQTKDYGFDTSEYDCLVEPNSGELLTNTLDEDIAKTETQHELRIVQDQIIPYMIGIVDGAVSAPVYVPSGTSINVSDEVVVKASSIGKSLYNIIKKLIKRNNITRPLLIVGNEALEDAWSTNQVTGDNALLTKLFGDIPVFFDWDNIFSALGSEAIYVVNLDAFASYSWNNVAPNVSETSNLVDSMVGEQWLRWNDTNRFSSTIKIDKFQKKTCVSDSHDLIGRRMRSHFELLVAPDGACETFPKVIKIVCGIPTP